MISGPILTDCLWSLRNLRSSSVTFPGDEAGLKRKRRAVNHGDTGEDGWGDSGSETETAPAAAPRTRPKNAHGRFAPKSRKRREKSAASFTGSDAASKKRSQRAVMSVAAELAHQAGNNHENIQKVVAELVTGHTGNPIVRKALAPMKKAAEASEVAMAAFTNNARGVADSRVQGGRGTSEQRDAAAQQIAALHAPGMSARAIERAIDFALSEDITSNPTGYFEFKGRDVVHHFPDSHSVYSGPQTGTVLHYSHNERADGRAWEDGRDSANKWHVLFGDDCTEVVMDRDAVIKGLVPEDPASSSGAMRKKLAWAMLERKTNPGGSRGAGWAPPVIHGHSDPICQNIPVVKLVCETIIGSANIIGVKRDAQCSPPGRQLPKPSTDTRAALEADPSRVPDLVVPESGVGWLELAPAEQDTRRSIHRTMTSGSTVHSMLHEKDSDDLSPLDRLCKPCSGGCDECPHGVKTIRLRYIYTIWERFLWFVRRFDRSCRDICVCSDCQDIFYLTTAINSLTNSSHTASSLFRSTLCPVVEKFTFDCGQPSDDTDDTDGGGYDLSMPKRDCLLGECDDCPGLDLHLTPDQAEATCQWMAYRPVFEGYRLSADGKFIKKNVKRERLQKSNGKGLETAAAEALSSFASHKRLVMWQHPAVREVKQQGVAFHGDFIARWGGPELYQQMGSEICPSEVGGMAVVVTRPWQAGYDDDDIPLNSDGMVEEHHVVMFDFGKDPTLFVTNQKAPVTEACFDLIILRHYLPNGYDFDQHGIGMPDATGGFLSLISDRCACQFLCADHFGAMMTWVNPGHSPNTRGVGSGPSEHDVAGSTLEDRARAAKMLIESDVAAAPAPVAIGDEAIDKIIADTSLSTSTKLKLLLNLKELRRHWGAAAHGKYTGDGLGGVIKQLMDELVMGWLGDANKATCETPSAEWFVTKLTESYKKPKGASSVWKSRRDGVTTAAVFFHHLAPSFVEQIEDEFLHYATVKPPSGAPVTSKIQEMRFTAGQYLQFEARDTSCACKGCVARPIPGPCTRASQVPGLRQYTLESAGPGVSDDGGEEDEENFAALHGSKAGDIAAFDVHDAQLTQDTTARRDNDDDGGHIAWLMVLSKPAFPLSRPARDSRREGRLLPAGTLVCEGNFLEYTHVKKRGRSEWERGGKLPDAANEYYAAAPTALLAVDVPGSRCLGHFYMDAGIEVSDVASRLMAKMRKPDQPEPLEDKVYKVSAACDAVMQTKIGIYSA